MAQADSKLCFVIMPFGEKVDVAGQSVQFDEIYEDLIKHAIQDAGLSPLRCDEVQETGLIHRKMIEHIWEAEVAVVDISLLNPNVFYELGVRHSLRTSVTVLIRRVGTDLPFNIANLSVIEYDESNDASLQNARGRISRFIEHGLQTRKNDSLVHEVLDLRIQLPTRSINRCNVYEYRLRESGDKSICLVTGDLKNIRGIDVWVNSENTNMQMARFYDWSISSVIRYLGAKRNAIGHVIEDTIADALGAIVQGSPSVPAGAVIPTTAGELEDSHQVKRVFHVAAVDGSIGAGYRPVENIASCVTNSLKLADARDFEPLEIRSILFPLMGTGVAPEDLKKTVGRLFESALDYLQLNPSSNLNKIFFLAWSEDELATCRRELETIEELEPPTGPSALP